MCVGGGGGGAGEHVPPPPYEEDVSVLKKLFSRILCTVMVWWSLGCFRVVWGVSMDRTTVMLTDKIRKRVCFAL